MKSVSNCLVWHKERLAKKRTSFFDEETKGNALLDIEENHTTSARQIAQNNNVSHTMITKLFKASKLQPYKTHQTQEYVKIILTEGLNFMRK